MNRNIQFAFSKDYFINLLNRTIKKKIDAVDKVYPKSNILIDRTNIPSLLKQNE